MLLLSVTTRKGGPACAGGHQNPDDQAGTHATAAKEAAAHIFGRTTSEDKTVHDIATPDIKQRMADTMAVLNADTAQKALDVSPLPCCPYVQASCSALCPVVHF